MTRWIAASVEAFEHDVIGVEADREYTRYEAWQWLIAKAAWQPHKIRNKGRSVRLELGQLPAGRDYLAKTWRWTPKKVRTFLARLMSEGMIEMGQSEGHYVKIITICNYAKYQIANRDKGQSEGQSRASAGPEKGQTYTSSTNTPVDNNNPQHLEPAREKVADGAPRKLFDVHEVHAKLTTAANGSLCPTAVGLNAVAEPIGWLNSGADLDLDIVPAVAALAQKAEHGSISSWRYFEKAVTKNRDARNRKLPAAVAPKPANAHLLRY